MNLKNKKLIAVLVVPVVVIAAVAGYYLYPVEEPPISVEEGFAEIWLEDLPGPGEPAKNYDNLSATATTYINKDSHIIFDITPMSVGSDEHSQMVRLKLSAASNLSEDLNPDNFKFTFRFIETEKLGDNFGNFKKTYTITENASFSHEEWISPRSHVLHFEVHSNRFEVETLLEWDIWNTSWGHPATLEITASLGGLSEDVVATVHVHIVGVGEI